MWSIVLVLYPMCGRPLPSSRTFFPRQRTVESWTTKVHNTIQQWLLSPERWFSQAISVVIRKIQRVLCILTDILWWSSARERHCSGFLWIAFLHAFSIDETHEYYRRRCSRHKQIDRSQEVVIGNDLQMLQEEVRWPKKPPLAPPAHSSWERRDWTRTGLVLNCRIPSRMLRACEWTVRWPKKKHKGKKKTEKGSHQTWQHELERSNIYWAG